MKKILLPVTIAMIAWSCNSKSSNNGEVKDSTVINSIEEKKIPRLQPADIDVNKPIDAVEANFQINCWDGKKVEVAGYGYVFYGDSLETKGGLNLTDSMGGRNKLVDCRFANPPSLAMIAKTDMIHIRGKIRADFFGAVSMDSCEIIAMAKSIPTQTADPFGKGIMAAISLSKDYYKWGGIEISIIGDYYMTTTSTTVHGKTIRVDLKNSANYDKVAGCHFKEDPTDRIRVNEKGVIIKGKINTYTPYGTLMLEDCSLVNR